MRNLEHLSFNALNDAENCLRLFFEKRLSPEPLPEIRDSARDRGKLAHKMRELWLHAVVRGESGDGVPALALAAEPSCGPDYEEARTIFERWKMRWAISREDMFAVERYGRVMVEGVPLPIIGYDDTVFLDRVNYQNVLQDAKTGHDTTLKPEHEFQLDLSALRFEAEYNDPEIGIRTEIDFMRSGVVKPREWNEERRENVKHRVRTIWGAIDGAARSGEYPATPGSWCAYCPIVVQCAAAKLADGAGLIVTDTASAEAAVRHRILFSEASARLTGALRPWVDTQGPVTVGRATASFEGSESRAFANVPAVLDRLEPAEREKLDASLKFNAKHKGVKNLLDDPRLADLVNTKINPPKFVFSGTSEDLEKAEEEAEE